MDRQEKLRIDLTKEEIREKIKDLEPGTMLTLEVSDIGSENDQDQKEEGD